MINAINYESFLEEFKKTPVYENIKNDFDEIKCTNQNNPMIDYRLKAGMTFRELYGKTNYNVGGNTSISVVTLYYLNFLLEKNPSIVYDLGCGWNIWSRYYDNIMGIDCDDKNDNLDIHARFDQAFVDEWKESIESLMCVNMNIGVIPGDEPMFGCVPCTYENYSEQVEYLAQVLQPKGRAYFSISRHGMYKYTPDSWFEENNLVWYDFDNIKQKLLEDLKKLPIDIIAFEADLDMRESFPGFDGCVRLVFEKH